MKKRDSNYDVIIVGAGPAGCIASIVLSRRGASVCIIDKKHFPREKVCGDYLTPSALNILGGLGIFNYVMGHPHNLISEALIAFPDGELKRIKYTGSDNEKKLGIIMRRMEFDNALLTYAKDAGVVFKDGFFVSGPLLEKDRIVGVEGFDDSGRVSYYSNIVIAADGVNSRIVAKTVGRDSRPDKINIGIGMRLYIEGMKNLEPDVVNFIYDEHLPPPCYLWVFPLSNGASNVGISITSDAIKRLKISMKRLFLEILEANPFFKGRLSRSFELLNLRSGLLRVGPPDYKLHAPGLLIVGDAAASINPISGEGISYAMETGRIAADVALKALDLGDFGDRILSEYSVEGMAGISAQFRQASALQQMISEEPNYIKEIYKSTDDPEPELISDFMGRELDFFTKFVGRNERIFSNIESCADGWPESILSLWLGLKKYLNLVSSTGDYRDFFNFPVHSFPALPMHWWLDLGLDLGSRKEEVDEIAESTLFYYFYLRIQDNVIDEPESFKSDFLILANECIKKVFLIYHRLFPPESGFWPFFNRIWTEYSDIALWDLEKRWDANEKTTDKDLLFLGKKFLPAAIPCVALAFLAKKEEMANDLVTMIENLGTGTQLLNDFLGIEKDLLHGKSTFLIYSLVGAVPEVMTPEEANEKIYQGLYGNPHIRDYFSMMIEYFKKSKKDLPTSKFIDFHSYIDFKISDINDLGKSIIKDIIKKKLNL